MKGFKNTGWSDRHYGTSFLGHKVVTSVSKLRKALGTPAYKGNDGEEKTNFEWAGLYKDHPVSVYDWKEYRPISRTEEISFHLGGKNEFILQEFKEALEKKLQEV